MSFWRFILWILTVSHFLKLTFSDFAKSPLAERLIVNKVVGGKGTNVLDVPLLRLGVFLCLLLLWETNGVVENSATFGGLTGALIDFHFASFVSLF